MSSIILKVVIVLALLFFVGIAAILVIAFVTMPTIEPQRGIPNTGNEFRVDPTAQITIAPTLHYIPPVPNDVHALAQNPLQSVAQPPLDPQPVPAPTTTPISTEPPISADEWRQWPALPAVSENARRIYQAGIANGSDPHAFSILGDCQSQPDVFLGVYDQNPTLVAELPQKLQETVANFQGSFNRYSPTVRDASTAGAMLYAAWNNNRDGLCNPGETPLDCELRTHRPSIVLISLGTHWETRNEHYLIIILDTILAHNALPVLVTKADDREVDWRINRDMAVLAVRYNIPLWNYWADVQDLPNHGLYPTRTIMPLIPPALARRQISGLQVLDEVWHAVQPPAAN